MCTDFSIHIYIQYICVQCCSTAFLCTDINISNYSILQVFQCVLLFTHAHVLDDDKISVSSYFSTNTCMFQTSKDTYVQCCMCNQMFYITSTIPEHDSKRISIFAAVPLIRVNRGYRICVFVLVW